MTTQTLVEGLDDETRENIAGALWLPDLQADQLPRDLLERLGSAKSSNRTFGERLQSRLRHLLQHPDSFTPSYRPRHETLLDHAGSLTPHQATR